jgi:guanidinopropionase
VHFDAHLDTVDEVWGEKWGHASPFRRVIEEGLIDAKNSVSIGMRGPLNSGADLDFVKQAGLRIITPEEIRSMSAMNLASTFSMMVREDAPTYFTFDVDCLDPAFAPGTGTPCPGGFSSSEALAIIRAMQGIRIDGADVVEVLPDRDVAGITSFFAAHVIFEFLALDAVRRKGGKS